MNNIKVFCAVHEDEFGRMLQSVRRTVLTVGNTGWKEGKERMCATLHNNTFNLQTKVEVHPDAEVERVTINEMFMLIQACARPKKEFDEDTCKYCKQKVLWITDPRTDKRLPIDIKKRTAFHKAHTNDGVCANYIGELYVSHNNICKGFNGDK
jgi:hypothetical protein